MANLVRRTERRMAYYRVYLLSADDQIDGFGEITCGSDSEARTFALQVIGEHPAVEVWCSARLVGQYSAIELAAFDSSEVQGC